MPLSSGAPVQGGQNTFVEENQAVLLNDPYNMAVNDPIALTREAANAFSDAGPYLSNLHTTYSGGLGAEDQSDYTSSTGLQALFPSWPLGKYTAAVTSSSNKDHFLDLKHSRSAS